MKLPIGIQAFAKIREEAVRDGVDRTSLILRPLEEGKQDVLGRPRRFGQRLRIDTIAKRLAGCRPSRAGTGRCAIRSCASTSVVEC